MRRLTVLAGAALAVLALAACEVPAPTAPPPAPGLVVYGVLNPAGTEQVVMLMQSRAAVPDTAGRRFVPEDPIVSTGETPVRGARVVVRNAAGDSAVLVEDAVRRPDGLGRGVYRLWSGPSAAGAPAGAYLRVAAGGAFRLRVTARVGAEDVLAEASTRVPTVARPVTGPARIVRVGRDTVRVADPGAANAAGFVYSLRNEDGVTPVGDAQYRRAFEPLLVAPSGTDWAFAYAREVFFPGPRYVLSVAAADSNFFAYYSAEADPFADRSRRTNLTGASGVFGAALPAVALPVRLLGGGGSVPEAVNTPHSFVRGGAPPSNQAEVGW